MFSSILLLLLFACLVTLVLYKNGLEIEKPDQHIYIVTWLLVILIVLFRPSNMPDYSNYVDAFLYGEERMEFATSALVSIARFFSDSHLVVMFFYDFLAVTITMFAIKKNSHFIWGAILVWMSYMLIIQDMIQIRQAVSSAIFLMSVPCIYQKNLKGYLQLNFIGVFFHYSAIAVFPLYFISSKKRYKWFYLLLIPISYITYFMGMQVAYIIEHINIDFINALWLSKSTSLNNTEDVNLFNSRQIIQILICYSFWFNIDKIESMIPQTLLYLKIYTIGIAVFILFFDVPDIASRINVLYMVIEILLIPMLILVPSKRILGFCLFLFVILTFFATYYFRFVFTNAIIE